MIYKKKDSSSIIETIDDLYKIAKNFKQASLPNMSILRDLILEAKGNLSAAKFTALINENSINGFSISEASISRLLRENENESSENVFREPLKLDFLYAIAKSCYIDDDTLSEKEKENHRMIIFSRLFEANGFQFESVYSPEYFLHNEITNHIYDKLSKNGYSAHRTYFTKSFSNGLFLPDIVHTSYFPEFIEISEPIDNSTPPLLYINFDFWDESQDDSTNLISIKTRSIIEHLSTFFLFGDYWFKDDFQNIHPILVLINKPLFDCVTEYFDLYEKKGIKFSSFLSIALYDTEKNEVSEEYISETAGIQRTSLFFDKNPSVFEKTNKKSEARLHFSNEDTAFANHIIKKYLSLNNKPSIFTVCKEFMEKYDFSQKPKNVYSFDTYYSEYLFSKNNREKPEIELFPASMVVLTYAYGMKDNISFDSYIELILTSLQWNPYNKDALILLCKAYLEINDYDNFIKYVKIVYSASMDEDEDEKIYELLYQFFMKTENSDMANYSRCLSSKYYAIDEDNLISEDEFALNLKELGITFHDALYFINLEKEKMNNII